MNKRARTQLLLEFLVDIVCLIISNAVSFVLFSMVIKKIPFFEQEEWIRFAITLFMAYLVIFTGFHSNIDMQRRNRAKELRSNIQNTTLTYALFSVAIVMFKNPIVQSRYMLLSGYVLFTALSMIGRYFLKRYLTGYFTKSKIASYVGIITTSDRAEEFVKSIDSDWSLSIKGIVLLDNFVSGNSFKFNPDEEVYGISSPVTVQEKIKKLPKEILDYPVMSVDETFLNWMRASALDDVYINIPYSDDSEIQELIEELEDMGLTVHVNIPMLDDILSESKFDNLTCRVQYGLPMAIFKPSTHNYVALTFKRFGDIVTGLLGCILSAPIIAITAIPLKLESKGPLFFKQLRVGKNGRPFYIYKLRSMYEDAEERKKELMEQNQMEGLMFKMENDPRITKVGKVIRKLSIDELPQFFNVLRGDMSLVGTRPPTIDEFKQYESRHKRRLSMRPGITGLWQVSGRSTIQDFEEVVRLDCKYIDDWSLGLDFYIVMKTIPVVLTHKGAE